MLFSVDEWTVQMHLSNTSRCYIWYETKVSDFKFGQFYYEIQAINKTVLAFFNVAW